MTADSRREPTSNENKNHTLFLACKEGKLESVISSLHSGADIHFNDDTALREAARNGDILIIKHLIERGANISDTTDNGPLYAACKANKIEAVKFLLKSGATLNVKYKWHLYKSSFYGIEARDNVLLVNYLMNKIPLINKVTSNLIKLAYKNHDDELIAMLINKGIPKHAIMTLQLLYSLESQDYSFAQYAISNGADIHCDNDNLLRWACALGDLSMIEFLLKNGADVHANDDEALEDACAHGHYEMVRYLVEHGANVNANNGSPLKLACLLNKRKKNKFKITYLKREFFPNYIAVIKYLVDMKADIHSDNEAALRYSCQNKRPNFEVIKFLIDKGANASKVKDIILPALNKRRTSHIYNDVLNLINKTSQPKLTV